MPSSMAVKAAAFASFAACISAESPWWMTVNDAKFPEVFAKSLESDSFHDILAGATEEFALIDFYSPWCPHCQHFAPEFERLTLGVNGRSSGHEILTGTVDCVANEHFCEQWGVNGYPTLRWGRRVDFIGDNALTLTEHIDYHSVHSAESVAGWITENTTEHIYNESIPSVEDFGPLMQAAVHQPTIGQHNLPLAAGSKADFWDVQLAVGLLLHYAFAGAVFEGEPKQALLNFIQLLADRLPELTQVHDPQADQFPCRTSLQTLHDDLSAPDSPLVHDVHVHISAPDSPLVHDIHVHDGSELKPKVDYEAVEEHWRFCGTEWHEYTSGWGACKGTWPGKRGYTCGLWTTLHTLAASAASAGLSADRVQQDHDIMRGVLWFFFGCDDCRDHFFRNPVHPEDVATPAAAQLWWWHVHNEVNARVGQNEQQDNSGDPAYPKVQWPGSDACPNCRHASLVALVAPHSVTSFLQASTRIQKDSGLLRPPPSDGAAPTVADSQPPGTGLRSLSDAEAEEGWDLARVAPFLTAFYSPPVPVF